MDDPVLFVKRTTDWWGADVVIDAVGCDASGSTLQTILGKKLLLQAGSATALHWAVNSVKRGGILSIIGVYGPPWNLFSIGSAMNKGITIRTNQASVKRLLPRLIDHIMAGRLSPKDLITHRMPLEEIPDAYHMFSAKRDNMLKCVLIPPKANAA
jgi:threonine dehydrogenase-like Zn-dependent dehydrogenase